MLTAACTKAHEDVHGCHRQQDSPRHYQAALRWRVTWRNLDQSLLKLDDHTIYTILSKFETLAPTGTCRAGD